MCFRTTIAALPKSERRTFSCAVHPKSGNGLMRKYHHHNHQSVFPGDTRTKITENNTKYGNKNVFTGDTRTKTTEKNKRYGNKNQRHSHRSAATAKSRRDIFFPLTQKGRPPKPQEHDTFCSRNARIPIIYHVLVYTYRCDTKPREGGVTQRSVPGKKNPTHLVHRRRELGASILVFTLTALQDPGFSALDLEVG